MEIKNDKVMYKPFSDEEWEYYVFSSLLLCPQYFLFFKKIPEKLEHSAGNHWEDTEDKRLFINQLKT